MDLTELIDWRYANKTITSKIVAEEKINAIINATLLCSSSSGLQPFHIILISNKEMKKKILSMATNQSAIEQSSHLMVFAVWDSYSEERINNHFTYLNSESGIPDSATDKHRKMVLAFFKKLTPLEHFNYAVKQSYIGLGYATIAAENEQVDITPMEGINLDALDELLELKILGLKSTAIISFGYRDEITNWLLKMKKVREPMQEFITVLK